jgi:hypothetical protein
MVVGLPAGLESEVASMRRAVWGSGFVLVALVVANVLPVVSAAPAASDVPRNATLAALWTKVLQTPSPQNPYGTGGPASGCWDLDGTVAPLGPPPDGIPSCTVKPHTKLFIATTWECSTFDDDHPGFGTTEPALRACARYYDDRHSVAVDEVETQALNIVLPTDNIFGAPAGHGVSVAHGWVTLLQPLTPGNHTIVIRSSLPTTTTTIRVTPGH